MRANPYSWLILVVIAVFLYIGNGMTLPTIFFGETKITNAMVVKNQLVPYIFTSKRQMLTYQFYVGDSLHNTVKKISGRKQYIQLGTEISVRYSLNDFSKNEIVEFYKPTYPIGRMNYFWNDSLSTEELKFINELVTVEKKSMDNVIIESKQYQLMISDNYIHFMPLLYKSRTITPPLRSFKIENQKEKEVLVDAKSGKVYR